MGNWRLVVEGVGAHHNTDYFGDADRIAKQAVELLIAEGQSVTSARFEHGLDGNFDNLLPGPAPAESSAPDVQTSAVDQSDPDEPDA